MPEAVSTWGANTTSGFSASMAATTSSMGAGDHGDWWASVSGEALSTVVSDAMAPASRICDQRKEKRPLRTISAFFPVATWRATDSIA